MCVYIYMTEKMFNTVSTKFLHCEVIFPFVVNNLWRGSLKLCKYFIPY